MSVSNTIETNADSSMAGKKDAWGSCGQRTALRRPRVEKEQKGENSWGSTFGFVGALGDAEKLADTF